MLWPVLFWFASLPLQWLLLVTTDKPMTGASADRLGNFYAVEARNALVKLDSNGVEMFRYQRTGNAPLPPDATNPLKLVLHFPATGNVTFLDNTLSPIGSLDLQPLGYYEGTSVCIASDDKLWVYNPATHRLEKLDLNGTPLREGADLLQHAGFAPDVIFMREREQKVYLCDSTRGIIVADAYGNYETTLPFKGLHDFQFVNDRLVYYTPAWMMFYNLKSMQTDSIALTGVATFRRAVYTNDRLLALGENGLSLYRLVRP